MMDRCFKCLDLSQQAHIEQCAGCRQTFTTLCQLEIELCHREPMSVAIEWSALEEDAKEALYPTVYKRLRRRLHELRTRRVPTPYRVFLRENRDHRPEPKTQLEDDHMTKFANKTRTDARQWRSLTHEEKMPYITRARELRCEHKKIVSGFSPALRSVWKEVNRDSKRRNNKFLVFLKMFTRKQDESYYDYLRRASAHYHQNES